MNKKLFILLLVSVTSASVCKNIYVSTIPQLSLALNEAKPGDIVVMKNGVWTDAVINFNSKATPAGPIILKAETPGKVILSGASKLIFSAPYLMAEGLFFKDGAIKGSGSENDSTVILFASYRCRLKNCAVIDYNPEDYSTFYYWVFFKGSHNRMDDCSFIGKNNLGPVVGNDYSGLPGGKDAEYNRADHCYFKDITCKNSGGSEVFRIWGYGLNGGRKLNGAFFTIQRNLFENAGGEGAEIISLRSNYNTVRYNTVRDCKGAIVLRYGNFNRLEGNFILGGNEKGTQGIRVAGAGHNIMNNYICNIDGDGLILMAGEFTDSALTGGYKPVFGKGAAHERISRYAQVIGGMFSNNTFVNIKGTDIVIGADYMRDWPESQCILLPEDNNFFNDLILKTNRGISIRVPKTDLKPPLNRFKFKPNIYAADIIYGGSIEIHPLPKGIRRVNPLLKLAKDGLYRPEKNSPAIGQAVEPFVNDDMDGQPRKSRSDIGADEVSDEPITRRPLIPEDVGAPWMR